ncbi:Uncharacterised protein [Lederbergia lenta]|uniref:Uncharacterized protein n=2 Tax=Lederbergia lenta TaxID=1467 RepID=A0A2X4W5T1_LEDLE|nr:Uncharacterised protein [Lederbergia lenta]
MKDKLMDERVLEKFEIQREYWDEKVFNGALEREKNSIKQWREILAIKVNSILINPYSKWGFLVFGNDIFIQTEIHQFPHKMIVYIKLNSLLESPAASPFIINLVTQ